jgi:hypothetical protein
MTELSANDFNLDVVLGLIRAGADTAIAAAFAGISPETLDQMQATDAALERALRKAGAESTLAHLHNIHEAAKDPRNWRLSVWWLERSARQTSDTEGAFSAHAFYAFWADMTHAINRTVSSDTERRELLEAITDAKFLRGLT